MVGGGGDGAAVLADGGSVLRMAEKMACLRLRFMVYSS